LRFAIASAALILGCAPTAPPTAASKPSRPPPRDVDEAIANERWRMKECFNQALRIDRHDGGVLKLELETGPDGRALSSRPIASSMSAGLTACMVSSIAQIAFPPPKGGYARFVVPFLLVASDCWKDVTGRTRCSFRSLTQSAIVAMYQRGQEGVIFVAREGDDLRLLTQLPNLYGVDLTRTNKPLDLSPLAAIPGLRMVAGAEWMTDATPLAAMASVRDLDLEWTGIASIAPLRTLKSLEKLSLPKTVVDVAPLAELTALTELSLATPPSSFSFATPLQHLAVLNSPCSGAPDLSTLAAVPIRTLHLRDCERLTSLSGASSSLEELVVGASAVRELTPLAAAKLRILDVRGSTAVTSLVPLAKVTTLERVDVMGTGVTELWPLLGSAARLRWLGVSRAVPDDAVQGLRAQNPSLVVRKGD